MPHNWKGLQPREWKSNEIGQLSDGLCAGGSSQAEDVHSTCLTRQGGERKKEEEGQYVVPRLIYAPTLIKRRGLCSIDTNPRSKEVNLLPSLYLSFNWKLAI